MLNLGMGVLPVSFVSLTHGVDDIGTLINVPRSLILCGFYQQKVYFSCGTKDFLGFLYYASALPAIALFGLGQQRLPAIIPAMTLLVLMAVGIAPFHHTWARTVVNFFVFQLFLLWLHYLRENADRRLYSLRDQLKIQGDTKGTS